MGRLRNPHDRFFKETLSVKENAMTTAEKLICEGEERGIQKGIKKGEIRIAQKMLAKGMAIDEVVEITGLSLEEIQAIKISEDT